MVRWAGYTIIPKIFTIVLFSKLFCLISEEFLINKSFFVEIHASGNIFEQADYEEFSWSLVLTLYHTAIMTLIKWFLGWYGFFLVVQIRFQKNKTGDRYLDWDICLRSISHQFIINFANTILAEIIVRFITFFDISEFFYKWY